jgi:hypothetical protein
MKKDKFAWGTKIIPTRDCVESTGLVKDGECAISLGRNGEFLVLIRAGRKSIERDWSPNYWEVSSEPTLTP